MCVDATCTTQGSCCCAETCPPLRVSFAGFISALAVVIILLFTEYSVFLVDNPWTQVAHSTTPTCFPVTTVMTRVALDRMASFEAHEACVGRSKHQRPVRHLATPIASHMTSA